MSPAEWHISILRTFLVLSHFCHGTQLVTVVHAFCNFFGSKDAIVNISIIIIIIATDVFRSTLTVLWVISDSFRFSLIKTS